jgi:transcriptional regulator with XRE-family HTH domain
MYALMDFSNWLLEQMNSRGWSQADLSRMSGLTRQSVSDYINRRRTKPEPNALVSISKAFGMSPVTVFRKAGLLPDTTSDQAQMDDWQYLLNQLPPEEADEMRQIALMKIEKRQNMENAARAAEFKPKLTR